MIIMLGAFLIYFSLHIIIGNKIIDKMISFLQNKILQISA